MKKLFRSILLAAALFLTMLLLGGCDDIVIPPIPTVPPIPTPVVTDPVTPDEPTGFQTAVRFIVASDVHIRAGSGSEQEEQRLAKMFRVGYDYSASQSSHTTLDGVFFAGDCADNGDVNAMKKFFSIVNANARPETTVRAVTGNHEHKNNEFELIDWKNASGYDEADVHLTVNGFHFILLCTRFGDQYLPDQALWLDVQIKDALKDDPTKAKPIFVIQHLAPSDTAYGTEDWGSSALKGILKKYPQVVDFGGHSHFPINDPRSLWQGDYTVLNTGGLSYYEMGIVGVKTDGVFPLGTEGDYSSSATARDEAQFYIVEVAEDGRMRVQGYDMFTDSVIVSYDLGPFDTKDNFQYTEAKRLANAETPYFGEAAVITPTYTDDTQASFRFPQASCKDTVQHYRCELYQNGKCVSTQLRLSNNWYFPMPETLTVNFDGLAPLTDYTLKITAVSAFAKESAPITVDFSTMEEGSEAVIPGEMIFSLAFDENGNAIDAVSGTALTPCGDPVAAFNDSFGRMGAYMNGKSCYRYDDYARFYPELARSVSFEFFGKADVYVPNGTSYSDLFSNQQSGGCGIELTKDGFVQFYININGTYYYPQTKINAGEYVHVVGTFNGKTIKLYVNGELKDSLDVKGVLTVPQAAQFLVVGGDSDSGNGVEALMKGEVLAANVYSYPLSADEIAANYAAYIG